MSLRQPRFGFTFGFQNRPRPSLMVILDDIEWLQNWKIFEVRLQNPNQWRKLRHIAYYCNDDEVIDSITMGRWKISDFSSKQLSASLVMSEWWYNVSHFSFENAFVNSVYKLAAIVCQGVGDMWLMDLRIWKVYRLVSNIRRILVCN